MLLDVKLSMDALGQETDDPNAEQALTYAAAVGPLTEVVLNTDDPVAFSQALFSLLASLIAMGYSWGLPMEALWKEHMRAVNETIDSGCKEKHKPDMKAVLQQWGYPTEPVNVRQ